MICLIGGFVICILLGALISTGDRTWKENGVRHRIFFGWSISLGIVWSIIMVTTVWDSYQSYLSTRAFYDVTVEQYATAVTMYENKAVIDVESAAWTDLKYQGYQNNVSSLILDLRKNIVAYNNLFVKKSKMDANPFFSWIIIGMDDDMKLIRMKTASQHLK